MLGTVILLTGLYTDAFSIVSLSTLHFINSAPLHDRDLDAILDLLEKRAHKGKLSKEITSSSSSSESDNGPSFMEHLKNIDIIDLIQKTNKKNDRVAQNDKKRFRYRASPNSVNQYYSNHQHEPNRDEKSNNRLKDHILKLFQDGKGPLKKNARPRLTPNRLVSPLKLNDDEDQDQVDGLQKYSKIFVVLDPTALKNSKNKDDLPSLISKMLAESSSAIDKTRQDRSKKYRYKGFAVKDSLSHRRFRRDSKEMYGGGGGGGGGGMDLEDDYRPKRPRNDHGGGGGGGGGGRTAIPYIRHRGNIYERDH